MKKPCYITLSDWISLPRGLNKKLTNSDHERTLAGPFSARVPPNVLLYMARPKLKVLLAIFSHSMQQKWDQGTLGRQRSTSLGPGPAFVLQWTQPWPYNTQTWPFIFWLYFCILCNKNGIKGHWGVKG